ncbi:hypothetical protein CSKR_103160, partial [Clonorchis sinensis]
DPDTEKHLSAMSKTTYGSTFLTHLMDILKSPTGATIREDILPRLQAQVETMICTIPDVRVLNAQKKPL